MPDIYICALSGHGREQKRALTTGITGVVVADFDAPIEAGLRQIVRRTPVRRAAGVALFDAMRR